MKERRGFVSVSKRLFLRGLVALLPTLVTLVIFVKLIDFVNTYVGAYIDQAPTAQSWFLNSRTWDNGLNDEMIKYYQDAVNSVLNNQATPQEALEVVEQGIVSTYQKYDLNRPR